MQGVMLDQMLILIFDLIMFAFIGITAIVYTYSKAGMSIGKYHNMRYLLFGVTSFIVIGVFLVGYILFLYLGEPSIPIAIGQGEFDIAHGFLTAFLGTAVGVFVVVFAMLKRREVIIS